MGDIFNGYFDWLVSLVDSDHKHNKLYRFLDSIEFRYSMEMDGNRYEDGLCMRREYIYAKGADAVLYESMAGKPCSVLEMMVGLANRCEQHIMHNSDFGDRTKQWFQYMIDSLGLMAETDDAFNESRCRYRIDMFTNRRYSKDGTGGLFYIPDARERGLDLTKIEIWDQAMIYLNGILF